MGYLLTKKAANSNDKGSIDLGKILGGGVAGGGLLAGKMVVDDAIKNKVLSNSGFKKAVEGDSQVILNKLIKMTGGDKGWLARNLWKAVPGESHYVPSLLNKAVATGTAYTAGFKNLKLPGKLKALGLLAAPLAAGGLIDAAVD